jgi:RNA polymerase sigma-70 factor (ECF subfamily)
MVDTSVSLLERLRLRADADAWRRLVELYEPLLNGWLRRYAVPAADAADLVQEVLTVLVRELPEFRHDLRRGAFRRWLRNILLNRLRAFWRTRRRAGDARNTDEILARIEDPSGGLEHLWEQEHDRCVLARLTQLLRTEFEPVTWDAFRLAALEGRPYPDVAAALGLSVNAVRIAKSRVLKRMRQEAAGLID